MKYRELVLFNGERFLVPQGIQRIDTGATHGWQVRYQGTRLFSDHTRDGSGARQAFELATRELMRRIAALPAPVTLQRAPSAHKTSALPPGISGPIIRTKKGSTTRTAVLSVLLPCYGAPARRTSVHIGSENTYSVERFEQALARAVELRAEAERAYTAAATQARRRAGLAMRRVLRDA
ncbi:MULTISPECIES: hypothetical protein [Rubrivivax]|uniref:AP2 domain-containing protein n=2 Tax=Sphaerotilaceae TaxID=2975441 RepID=A0ABX0HZC1_9BURK|nr:MULTISPECIES: hypothetical protein [Rubrivivax]EGJ09078.1 hypothetical protein RBXJA2T_02055 [Rubrivivax benzoatilyticus JA2 = ATCC BAA-35]NHL00359.1 hypothetical protein [Rubrivivax benzoatilyticus]NHL26231.1 hypothetical protein [Rubrivivax benzoatilyticus]